ncbi:hypothetical protein CPB83DRAFT_898283 [Crepidotus variabilis]|uniref:Nephrocystin 3-like N-terminal domain-containing protein n=1 Tax=Crepidotus variabilis TaxID=179855 RepID=A0A9P6E7R9_9AGAR|nr:hypothetical protein CPB83DRAFT_898283 [Crepidotus variabilis]
MSLYHPYRRSTTSNVKIKSSRSPNASRDDNPSQHSTTSHTAIFSHNNHVEVSGGSFTIYNKESLDTGLLLLNQAVSKEAMHDSSARHPPPKCHPETRKEIINFFVNWAKKLRSSELVYWLHAPFGHGKSAVVQCVVDQLIGEGRRDLVAGAFFFGRGKPGRNKITHLLPTIAYQIAINVPGMREHINSAVMNDPALLSRSVEVQLRSLIINPLLNCDNGPHLGHHPTVFIDGLDECDTIEAQIHLLDVIASALRDHDTPLRFLISSRPEAHIRDAFGQDDFNDVVWEIQLPDNDAEMFTYLASQFNEIYDNRARFMKAANVRKPWPTPEQIHELVKRACGQYVFLNTITRFIGVPSLNPVSQLKIVLGRLSDQTLFTDMDSIYRLVLERCPYQHVLTVVVGSLLQQGYNHTSTAIADIWQLPVEDIQLVIEHLVAIVEETEGGTLLFRHLSFREFLEDESRSGRYYCDGILVSVNWSTRLQKAFKLALSGELLIRNDSSLSYFTPMLHSEIQQPCNWTSPSELAQLLLDGYSRAMLGSDELMRWYRVVEFLLRTLNTFFGYSWPPQTLLAQWTAGELNTPFTIEVQKQCLAIWKDIVDTALSEMDPRLANRLLDLDRACQVQDLAKAVRLDVDGCLATLDEHRVLFIVDSPMTATSYVQLRDNPYFFFNEDGTRTYVHETRRQFYDNRQ